MTAIGGWKALIDAVDGFGAAHPFTALIPVFDNVDPDDAFSSIPYEKGSTFLYVLETLVDCFHSQSLNCHESDSIIKEVDAFDGISIPLISAISR